MWPASTFFAIQLSNSRAEKQLAFCACFLLLERYSIDFVILIIV